MLRFKLKIIFLIFFWCSATVFSEGTPFAIRGKISEKGEDSTISLLKYQAIIEWLNKSSFKQYEKELNSNLVDMFILDYKIERLKSENEIELQGHIDSRGLIDWIRNKEAKKYAPAVIKPILIVSSEIRGFTLIAEETTQNIKNSVITRVIHDIFFELFRKMNLTLETFNGINFSFKRPPEKSNNIKKLKEYFKNFNCIFWTHFSQKGANNIVKVFLYDIYHNQIVSIESSVFDLPKEQFSNISLVKKELSPIIERLEKKFKEVINSGKLTSHVYELKFENLSLKDLSIIERELLKQAYVKSYSLKLFQKDKTIFELYSDLDINSLINQLGNTLFEGLRLEFEKVGYNNIKVFVKD